MTWPDVVWDASLLRGLDARARAEIEAAGRVRNLKKNDVLFKHGDPADALFVVAAGACALTGVRRGDDTAGVIRRAKKGDVLGEEATVADFGTRQLEARAEEDAVVAEVPLVVLRRAIGRAGGTEPIARIERALRRAATLDLLRTASFTRTLGDGDLDLLLDAAQHVQVARGEALYRAGAVAEAAYLVADGLLQAQTDDDGKPRIEAYLSRGDLFGDDELADREPRRLSVMASGPAWVVAIPRDVFVVVARKNGKSLTAAHRLKTEPVPPVMSGTTTQLFQDVYRLRVARSLLVIDQDACIRCGHCAWSCADVHADGVSRLVRRGDKVATPKSAPKTAPLLVPNSCQHCKNPACMIDCPTGAIGRDARGEVFIREDLCTGCGSCAKACPWENISLAPRNDAKPFPAVAVKCDLCKGSADGPACVNACPTEAIARIDPNEALLEPTAAAVLPARMPAWPWLGGAVPAAIGVALLNVSRKASGLFIGVMLLVLLAYALGKRVRAGLPRRGMYIAHMSVGIVSLGLVIAHVGTRIPPNVAGALTLALGFAVLTGLFGGVAGAIVPPQLTRLERKVVLPEELAGRAGELDAQVFRTLSGKSELVKTLFVKVLRPYLRSRPGPLVLIATRRSLKEEETRLRARLDALTGKPKNEPGLGELVKLVVEHRAVRAQRVLTWILRGWLVPHIAATIAVVVLTVLHVIGAFR